MLMGPFYLFDAEFQYAECCYAECRYAECHYAECRYAECHYAESKVCYIVLYSSRTKLWSNLNLEFRFGEEISTLDVAVQGI